MFLLDGETRFYCGKAILLKKVGVTSTRINNSFEVGNEMEKDTNEGSFFRIHLNMIPLKMIFYLLDCPK